MYMATSCAPPPDNCAFTHKKKKKKKKRQTEKGKIIIVSVKQFECRILLDKNLKYTYYEEKHIENSRAEDTINKFH